MTQKDALAKAMAKFYRENSPEEHKNSYLIFCPRQLIQLEQLNVFLKKKIIQSNEKIPISVNENITYSDVTIAKKQNRISLIETSKTGVYKIIMKNGNIVLHASYKQNSGKMETSEFLWVGMPSDIKELLVHQKGYQKRASKPKPGLFFIQMNNDGSILYHKEKPPGEYKVFHQNKIKIEESIDFYFKNVEKFQRFNQPGRRTILLYGRQGTGKTSIISNLIREYSKNTCVVYCFDASALISHVKNCEKHQVPTIVIVEDADGMLVDDTIIKNFLSGSLAGQNKKGTVIIFTANNPQKIHATILNRKDRIDETYEIGDLDFDSFKSCLEEYLSEYIDFSNWEEKDYKFLHKEFNLSGSMIKSLSTLIMKDLIKSNKEKASFETLVEILKSSKEAMEDLISFNAQEEAYKNLSRKTKIKAIGFRNESY